MAQFGNISRPQLGNITRDQVLGGEYLGDKFFLSYGINIGFGTLPSNKNNYTYLDIGVLFNGRYNYYEINNNQSFGIDVAPEVGSYSSPSLENYLGFSIPLMASYNLGLGSTYESDNLFGLALKAGVELDVGPLIGDRVPNFIPLLVHPVVQLDIRFWKRAKRNIRDLYIKYGYISNETDGPNFTLAVGALYIID